MLKRKWSFLATKIYFMIKALTGFKTTHLRRRSAARKRRQKGQGLWPASSYQRVWEVWNTAFTLPSSSPSGLGLEQRPGLLLLVLDNFPGCRVPSESRFKGMTSSARAEVDSQRCTSHKASQQQKKMRTHSQLSFWHLTDQVIILKSFLMAIQPSACG